MSERLIVGWYFDHNDTPTWFDGNRLCYPNGARVTPVPMSQLSGKGPLVAAARQDASLTAQLAAAKEENANLRIDLNNARKKIDQLEFFINREQGVWLETRDANQRLTKDNERLRAERELLSKSLAGTATDDERFRAHILATTLAIQERAPAPEDQP